MATFVFRDTFEIPLPTDSLGGDYFVTRFLPSLNKAYTYMSLSFAS